MARPHSSALPLQGRQAQPSSSAAPICRRTSSRAGPSPRLVRHRRFSICFAELSPNSPRRSLPPCRLSIHADVHRSALCAGAEADASYRGLPSHQKREGLGPAAGGCAGCVGAAFLRSHSVQDGDSAWREALATRRCDRGPVGGVCRCRHETAQVVGHGLLPGRAITRTGAVVGHTDTLALHLPAWLPLDSRPARTHMRRTRLLADE